MTSLLKNGKQQLTENVLLFFDIENQLSELKPKQFQAIFIEKNQPTKLLKHLVYEIDKKFII